LSPAFRIPVALGRSTAPSPGSHLVLTEARVTRPVFDELTGRGVHVTQAFGMSEGLFLLASLDAPADLRAETVEVPGLGPLMKSWCSGPARKPRSPPGRPES
jgi:hypothetical protein